MPALTRHVRHRRSSRKNLAINYPQPTNPIYITDAQGAGAELTLTLDQAVTLNGTPAIAIDDLPDTSPIGAVQLAPNMVRLTFDASVAAGTMLSIPFRDPAIRSAAGGYLTADKSTMTGSIPPP